MRVRRKASLEGKRETENCPWESGWERMVEARLAGRVKREDMEMGGRQDEVVARQATALRDTQLIGRSATVKLRFSWPPCPLYVSRACDRRFVSPWNGAE